MEKSNKRFQKISHEKGITLVALVITIIILIILSTIAISNLFGDNGLLEKATDAGAYYSNKAVYIDDSIANMTSYIDETIGGIKSEEGRFTSDGVPIPEGFYYVGGTKEEGVVISDNQADENKGTSYEVAQELIGNQFVWIPVEDTSSYQRYVGYYNGSLESDLIPELLDICNEPYEEGYEEEAEEYNAMYVSVIKNKGFYVGRYETGTTSTSARTSSSGTNVEDTVVKQGVYLYNYIGWNSNGSMSSDEGGAVELARQFADANQYTSVTSTLIYGVQWDAIMNFIDSNYSTGTCDTNTSYVANSTGKGNYTGIITATGSNSEYSVKNIYDLAGNASEWTMEALDTRYRVIRGGNGTSGLQYPASFRNGISPSASYADLGFRIALYIN